MSYPESEKSDPSLQFYKWSILVSSSIMILLFCYLWIKLRKSTENEFPAKLSLCMAVANLFMIGRFISGRLIYNECASNPDCTLEPSYKVMAYLWVFSVFVYLTAFNLGNWYFGFHYFKCASEMKFVNEIIHDKSALTKLKQQKKRNDKIFKSILFLNIAAIVIYVGILFKYVIITKDLAANELFPGTCDLIPIEISKFLVYSFQMLSFSFLLIGNLKIRRLILGNKTFRK